MVIWKTNFCSTLTRHRVGVHTMVNYLHPSFLHRNWTLRQLVSSTFYKSRAMFCYLLGRSLPEFQAAIPKNTSLIRYASETVPFTPKYAKLLGGKVQALRFHQNSRFKLVNRRLLTGTGLTFGLVGVCMKNENGYPVLSSEMTSKPSLDLTHFFQSLQCNAFELKELREDVNSVDHIKFGNFISKGCCGAVYKGEIKPKDEDNVKNGSEVAVKMLFNYEVESNATAIITSALKECLPYNGRFGSVQVQRRKILPPHPNIVKILTVFADYFQPLEDSHKLYPQALPRGFGGYGRNMTLFVVQKLYDMSLKDYLKLYSLSSRNALAVLTQCFEAVSFLNKNQVAHRDLKVDNILVSLVTEYDEFPWIVITDFGLSSSVKIPYQTEEVCRGGNRALMAPEIVNAVPSRNSYLDYSKSDLWAMATIGYEIFGADNPFYKKRPDAKKLDSATYKESELPSFPSSSPILVKLIAKMLTRDPNMRPTGELTADVCHLLYHLGSSKVCSLLTIENTKLRGQIAEQWLRLFTFRTMYRIVNGADTNSNACRLKLIFLSKFSSKRLHHVLDELDYIYCN